MMNNPTLTCFSLVLGLCHQKKGRVGLTYSAASSQGAGARRSRSRDGEALCGLSSGALLTKVDDVCRVVGWWSRSAGSQAKICWRKGSSDRELGLHRIEDCGR